MKKKGFSIFNLESLDALMTTTVLNIAYIVAVTGFLTVLCWNGGWILALLFTPVFCVFLYYLIYASIQAVIEAQKETERNKKRNSDT